LLDDDGLAAALDNELRSRDLTLPGIDLLLEVEPEVARMRWPADAEYAAFMVAREATSNAVQHAKATLVRVVLTGDEGQFRIDVVDDGQGWALDTQIARPGHLGVVGMRERALATGARFSIAPNPAGGTIVRLEWGGRP
jgi:signal transduction histidine kinase